MTCPECKEKLVLVYSEEIGFQIERDKYECQVCGYITYNERNFKLENNKYSE